MPEKVLVDADSNEFSSSKYDTDNASYDEDDIEDDENDEKEMPPIEEDYVDDIENNSGVNEESLPSKRITTPNAICDDTTISVEEEVETKAMDIVDADALVDEDDGITSIMHSDDPFLKASNRSLVGVEILPPAPSLIADLHDYQLHGISWMVHMFKHGMPMILGDQVFGLFYIYFVLMLCQCRRWA